MIEYVVMYGPVAVGASTCLECARKIQSRYPIGTTYLNYGDVLPTKHKHLEDDSKK